MSSPVRFLVCLMCLVNLAAAKNPGFGGRGNFGCPSLRGEPVGKKVVFKPEAMSELTAVSKEEMKGQVSALHLPEEVKDLMMAMASSFYVTDAAVIEKEKNCPVDENTLKRILIFKAARVIGGDGSESGGVSQFGRSSPNAGFQSMILGRRLLGVRDKSCSLYCFPCSVLFKSHEECCVGGCYC